MSFAINLFVPKRLPLIVVALTVVALGWGAPGPVEAAEFLVLADGSGPYPNIQLAIDAASQADTVVVGAGVYTGVNNRDFNVENDLLIRAQYPGDAVIIDLQGSVANPHMGFDQVDGSLSLEGLTIQNAYSTWGAVRVRTADFSAKNCTFVNNTADRGGAVSCDGGDNVFLNDCVFVGNKANIEGGAIYATTYGEIHLTNCTLFMNDCDNGAAIYRHQEATLDMESCIVAYSRGTYTFKDYYGGAFTIANTDIWGNEGGDWTGMGALLGVDGNINVEPEMCDPADGNLALTLGSPCAVSPSLIMGGAGQDLLWDVPVYGLHDDGSGMFPTIQGALAAVPAQASIALSAGTYAGDGNVALDFLGKEIELASRTGHTVVIDAASWDGQPRRVIQLAGGEPAGTTVRDLTIRNGQATGSGAGVFVSGGSSLALRNIFFQNNLSDLWGGAVAAIGNSGGEVVIDACTFDGNESDYDVHIGSGSLWIGNVAFGPTSTGSVVLTSSFAGGTFSNVSVEGCTGVSGSIPSVPLVFENCTMVCSGANGRTAVQSCQDLSFINCDFRSVGAANTELVSLSTVKAVFEDCSFEGLGAAETDVGAVKISDGTVTIRRSSFTNLNPGASRGAVSLLSYSSATLDSCTFQQTAAGVVAADQSRAYVTIRDCGFTAVGRPVEVESAPPGRLTVTDTEFTVCAQGVVVSGIEDVTLTRCGFRGTGPGIPVVAQDVIMSVNDCEFHDAQVMTVPLLWESGGISSTGSSVTVNGSEFLRNACEIGPGGINANLGNLAIADCLFADNTNLPTSFLRAGGAINCSSVETFSMTDSRLERNTAFEAGGAVIGAETITLDNCEIVDNTGTYAMGGLDLNPPITTGSLNMVDCVVARNTAPGGAGVRIYGSPAAGINRCTFVANGGPASVGQIEFAGTGSLTLQSSILAYGDGGAALYVSQPDYLDLGVTCTDIYGNPGGDWTGALASYAGLGGNIEADPWFCDANAGDYHLAADSPCVDTENLCGVTMGAYPVGCGVVSGVEDTPTIQRVALRQNHPNPFNPSTRISFELPRETDVTLRIYDLGGKLVREILDGEKMSLGVHEVTWNGRDNGGREQATGLYLYRLEAGGAVMTRKMALVR